MLEPLRQKKASLLGVVKGAAKEAVGPEVVVHVKAKSDDGGALMDGIFRAVNDQSGLYGDAPVVGHLAKEAPEGNLLEKWAEKLQIERFMVADKGPPIFQSGGEFDLRPSATSNDHNLFYETTSVILCAIGSRYSSYCSNVARTFLIDANPLQSKAYGVLLKAQEAVINALKPGRTAAGAYQAAVSIVEKEAPELAANLTRTAGTRIGLEFRESGLNLNGKSDKILKAGMVFNGSLGFQNLQTGTEHPKTQKVSVMLADTVVIGENGPEVLPPSRGLVIQID
uniref:FACT complex subunit n=1 Tax=Daucus carota subsp. sativus TaxID=79200 RepID=A0A166CWD1_DAUCS